MAMVVKNNMTAINTLNTLNKNSSALSKSLQKVSSGMKINSAADDASGYAISERMRVQIRSLDQANQNTQNGSSMMKVAEGAVSSTVEILKTLKEKAVNAANDSNTDSDRQTIQKELDQSIDQINDNANVTFNGKYLVDGSKNSKGNATYTALSNQSLGTDTTGQTKLTDLTSRSGDSLEIHDTDKVTVSYVQGGKTYSTTFAVKDETTGKVASLQDIFKNAEAIDSDSQIFASGDNKSVLEARIADEAGFTKADAENIAELKKKAIDNLTTKTGELKNAVNGVATEKTGVQTAVNNYNNAAAAWAGIVGTKGTGAETISAGKPANDGEYLDNIANSTVYKDAITADLTDTVTSLGAAKTDAVAKNTLAEALQAAKDKLAADGKAFSTELSSYLDEYVEKNPTLTVAQFGDAITDLSDKATAVGTQATALKTAGDAVFNADGSAKTGTKYEAYTKAKAGYAAAEIAADKFTAPYLLTGGTVGLGASNDTVTTASGENAITITANADGIGGQISGLNISVSDSQGNVKKSANAALDAFEETVRAQNKSDDNAISLQVGAKANQSIKVGLTDMRAEALGLQGADGTKLNISNQAKANAAINVLDNAIQKALDQQTTIGSVESRLEYTSTNLTTASENVQASESTIRDADMAKEMTNYTKNNVLLQAAQSMLAQANQSSSNVLSLLQ